MSTYFIKFQGRTKGAIGIFDICRVVVDAETPDAALLKLYDTHEPLHINVSWVQECPVRYVITHMSPKYGYRCLSHQSTYDTPELAQQWLDASKANNSADTLRSVYGDVALMRVQPVACWPGHHDPMRTVFED